MSASGNPLARRLRAVSGALLALAVAVAAQSADAKAAARVSWCVGAGAPMRGEPLLDGGGRVYLTTTDGYLHSFEPDGRYRWSYTVSGAVMGRPVIRASDGAVLVGTSDRWLYAVMDNGLLGFAYPTLVPVMSGLVNGPDGAVLFGGGDGFLYAFSPAGNARWRAPLGAILTGDPWVGQGGTIWVAAGRELLRLDKAWRSHRSILPAEAVGSPVGLGDGVVVVAGEQLVAFDREGRGKFSKPDVAFVATSGSAVITVSPTGRVELVDGSGQSRVLRELESEPSAPPLSSGGVIYVPLMNGTLAAIGKGNEPLERWPVADGALGRPLLDAPRHQLLVPVSGARICAVELPG